MAWLEQKPTGAYHIVFRIGAEKLRRSLKTKDKKEASARLARIEENIRLVESGRLVVPDDADAVSFLLSDGRLTQRVSQQKRLRLRQLHQCYIDSLPADSIEANSLYTTAVHMRHIAQLLDGRLDLRGVTAAHLQEYVNKRAKQPGRHGRNISATTIKKELATLRSLWNWAMTRGYVGSPLPLRGLKYPKADEKPPYRTRAEIEREIECGGLTAPQRDAIWHSLYLGRDEVAEVLSIIRQNAKQSYIYPMAVLAAYTGARRSELCRSEFRDIDIDQQRIYLREKKRNKSKRTYRQVPLASVAVDAMRAWQETKPRSPFTFPKPSTRTALPASDGGLAPISPPEAGYHLEQALRGSSWAVMPGWHVFRHSFISNCATRGVDQRMIDDWVGHQTDEQRKRYRHLFPDTQKSEIDRVF